jgi:hypothetical protein
MHGARRCGAPIHARQAAAVLADLPWRLCTVPATAACVAWWHDGHVPWQNMFTTARGVPYR